MCGDVVGYRGRGHFVNIARQTLACIFPIRIVFVDTRRSADAAADAEPTEAAKDNCFWFAGTVNADGSLSANGKVIEELKGLKFDPDYAAKRSLAIAVKYPSTSLGDYDGGAYLWLGGGGSKQTCPCFTIPGVKAGQKLTISMESHKLNPADEKVYYMKRMQLYNLVQLEKWAEAVEAGKSFFANALPKGSNYEVRDYTDYGQALQTAGFPEEAIDAYNKAIDLNPKNTDLIRNLGDSYADAPG